MFPSQGALPKRYLGQVLILSDYSEPRKVYSQIHKFWITTYQTVWFPCINYGWVVKNPIYVLQKHKSFKYTHLLGFSEKFIFLIKILKFKTDM